METKKKPTVTISVRVDPEIKEKLVSMANSSGFRVADHIKAALAFYIRRFDRKNVRKEGK